MRRLLICAVVLGAAGAFPACGGSGDVENDIAPEVQPQDTSWPDNLYVGDVDMMEDVPMDLEAVDHVDTSIPYDTDYIHGEGIITFDADTNADQYEDGVCVPACEFDDGTPKDCGPDGCGSLCGYCDYEHECVEGVCEVKCIPQCDGKECGPDGCYSVCPPGCDQGFLCGDDGKCYPDCDPDLNCEGKECGSDGCGGVCGLCALNKICDEETGLCEDHPCGDVPQDTGICQDQFTLVQCVDDQLVEIDCQDFGDDFYCKFDAVDQVYECAQGCVPKCTFDDGSSKECGYDGCYGNCGECTDQWDCVAGKCYPNEGAPCGTVPAFGMCVDNILWLCEEDHLYSQDCGDQACMYNAQKYMFECQ